MSHVSSEYTPRFAETAVSYNKRHLKKACLFGLHPNKILLMLITVFLLASLNAMARSGNKRTYVGMQFGSGVIYGNVLGAGFAFRKGFGDSGNFGIGGNVGCGYGKFADYNYLQYSAGIKLFPYKSIFLAGNFGLAGVVVTEYFNSGERWEISGFKKYHGPSALGGFEFRPGNTIITLGVGASYYMEQSEWLPTWAAAFGFKF
jgi:hypothetical protein